METVERGRVISTTGPETVCELLDEQGQPTGELVLVPPSTGYQIEILTWAPTPALTESLEKNPDLHAGEEIWLVRHDGDPGRCAKWAYYSPEEIKTAFKYVYRLVRVTDDGVEELWRSDPFKKPRWHQILVMSERWPKLADGSDELSLVYRSAGPCMAKPSKGLMFQVLMLGAWFFCWHDMRAPIEEVPAALRLD